jgi:hypothetical protein
MYGTKGAEGVKRYFVEYESDRIICGSNKHTWGYSQTIRTAMTYIARCRKEEAQYNPRNFKIYDTWGDIDPETNHVPCVYAVC